MVSVRLSGLLTEEFFSLIPDQKEYMNKLINQRKISSYGLTVDHTKVWIVFTADSEAEVWQLLTGFTLYKYMEVEIDEMLIYENTNLVFPQLFFN